MIAPARQLLRLCIGLGLVMLVAAGCQVQLSTTVKVDGNGKGTITQGIGFDDAALKRVGDPARAVRASDLEAAGWAIDPVVKEGDLTWLRVHQDFSSPTEANALLAQLSGPDGPYRDLSIQREDGIFTNTVKVSGEIDTSAGLAAFGDQALTVALGGDPSGGVLKTIEAEEQRPPAEMVGFALTVDVAGKTRTFAADFTKSESHKVSVSSTDSKFLQLLGFLAALVLTGLTVAFFFRRERQKRMRSNRSLRGTPYR